MTRGTGLPPPEGSPGATTHAWQRLIVGWHVGFWALIGLGLFRIGTATDITDGRRVLSAALFVGLGVLYLATLQRPVRVTGRAAMIYLTYAVAVVGVVCWADPYLSMLLFVVYPQAWMFTGSRWRSVVVVVAVTLSATAGFLTSYGWNASNLVEFGPQMAVSLLFSLLLGMWLSKIIDESAERAELIAQLGATSAALAEAHHAQGVAAERERMAREIHDTLAQGFTSIVMLTQAATAHLATDRDGVAQRLQAIEEVARENLAEARALVAAFSPVDLDGATLPDALRRLAGRFTEQTSLPVEVKAAGTPEGLSRAQEVVLLRVTQEALTNVRRHARATRATVQLVATPGGASIEVADDGVGFTASQLSPGFGLTGMRGRVDEVGGALTVDSRLGGGTRVTVRIPVPVAVLGSPAPSLPSPS